MRLALIVLVIAVVSVGGFFGYYFFGEKLFRKKEAHPAAVQDYYPLKKYTIENLSKRQFAASEIELGRILDETEEYVSRVFYFRVDSLSQDASNENSGRKVSGQINYPKESGKYPVIVMSRGYIEREGYETGDGTRRSSVEFARAGYITLAPDFLGYGESDMPSEPALEERFETYTTTLTLLESIGHLDDAFSKEGLSLQAEVGKIGLWGHSNGGQITLTVLEASGADFPTVLWAPVSKPFPYSILFYTDDFDDHGKMLRRVVADFEKDYDAQLYSLTNYLDRINAPISLHQGSQDEEVPIGWSNEFVLELRRLKKEVDYYTYPEDDHNFTNGSWQTVVSRNIEFYRENL